MKIASSYYCHFYGYDDFVKLYGWMKELTKCVSTVKWLLIIKWKIAKRNKIITVQNYIIFKK